MLDGSLWTMNDLLERYLSASELCRWTPGTFLLHELRGRARRRSGRYLRILLACLESRVKAGNVVRVPSARGGIAYVEVL